MICSAMERLRRFIENPYTNLIVGLILFITGLSDAWDTLYDDLSHLHFHVHHGIMIYGLFSVVKTIPDLFSSLQYVHQGVRK